MVVKGTPLPHRIAPDAIIEALFEIRFESVSPLPEVLFGRLAEFPEWNGFTQRTLPAYTVPAQFRDQDANLRYVPIFELSGVDPIRSIRIGSHVLSYHLPKPYLGWKSFSGGADSAVDGLFEKTSGLLVNRLGLRYINALTPAAHQIYSISDLDLSIAVSQALLEGNLNLNFTTDVDSETQCTVRIATPQFAQGQPADATVVVDVDVFTVPGFQRNSPDGIKHWMSVARKAKNDAFMDLFKPETLARLRRD
jgi:uncharacterized protein (TIGR04255 family)